MSSTYMAPAGCTADRAYSSIFGSPIHTRQQIAAQLWRLLLLFQWKLAQFFVVPSSCYPIFQKCWYWRPSAKEISPDLLLSFFDWEFFLYTYTHKSFKMTMTQEVECAACFRPIRDRFLLKVLDKPWHPACVRCELCRKLLDEKCFYKEGKMYCKDDFYR